MKRIKVFFFVTTLIAYSSSLIAASTTTSLQKCVGMHQCPALHDCIFGYCHKINPRGGGLAGPESGSTAPVKELKSK